jgi:hypothetical protein
MSAKSGLDVNGTIQKVQVLHCSLLHLQVTRVREKRDIEAARCGCPSRIK